MSRQEKKQFSKELMALAVPLALQNLLNALVGASDALMLGRLTQDAIAAVSLANQISFVMSLFNGAVIGAVGVLVAQYWGKKDYINAKRFLAMAVRYVAVISFVFFLSMELGPCLLWEPTALPGLSFFKIPCPGRTNKSVIASRMKSFALKAKLFLSS